MVSLSLKSILIVALGGSLGAILRYLAMLLVASISNKTYLATLGVNIVGSFLISFLSFKILESSSVELRLLVITGLLGAFTTMSSFSIDSLNLWKSGATVMAAGYIIFSILGSLFSCFLGYKLSGHV